MKKSEPINEITIPAGNSDGAKTVREKVSQSKTKMAPKIIEKVIKKIALDESFLQNFRIKCGAKIPTKLIVPPAQTAELTASELEIKTKI